MLAGKRKRQKERERERERERLWEEAVKISQTQIIFRRKDFPPPPSILHVHVHVLDP
jgi:hypothetical protein